MHSKRRRPKRALQGAEVIPEGEMKTSKEARHYSLILVSISLELQVVQCMIATFFPSLQDKNNRWKQYKSVATGALVVVLQDVLWMFILHFFNQAEGISPSSLEVNRSDIDWYLILHTQRLQSISLRS